MPLNSEHESAAAKLERLGQVIGYRPAANREPLSDPINALMMVLHSAVNYFAGDRRRKRALLQAHVVSAAFEGPWGRSVYRREVLDERAAKRNVEQLHPSADAQQWHVNFNGSADQADLAAIAFDPRAFMRRIRLRPIQRCIDVWTARQKQPIEALQQVHRRLVLKGNVGREQDSDPAGALHGLDEHLWNERRLNVPQPPARIGDVGGDRDQRAPW